MNALAVQILYRLKAILAAAFIALVGVAEWLVSDPNTASLIQQYLPAPWDKFAPGALGLIGVWLVHHYPNGEVPAAAVDTAPVTELPDTAATTAIPTITAAPSSSDR